jgi:hypothetical protein
MVENGGQRNNQEKNEKKLKFSPKIFCIGVWTLSPNLWFRVSNMGFVQHIQVKILPENFSQNKAEEENEKKKLRICKKFPAL